jgi:predicted O-methyltransferase YrrM
MPIDDRFMNAVRPLYSPPMGTEHAAPLLFHLIRFCRPQRVLEVGMGYTTPFLAEALADNEREIHSERSALIAKTRTYLGGDVTPVGSRDWQLAPPSFAVPGFYNQPHAPHLVAIDDLSDRDSSSSRTENVLADLDLTGLTTIINAPLDRARRVVPAHLTPFDFVWVDAWVALDFIESWWPLVSGDGGIVVLHYLLTYPEGRAILDYLKSIQETSSSELELLSLREPHKTEQNSVTVLRKTSEYIDPDYSAEAVQSDAVELLRDCRGDSPI